MKHIILLVGFLTVIGTAPAAAQTHVSVSIGFGVPVPPVVVVERSYYHRHRAPVVVVVRRPYARPLLVDRVVFTRHPRYHHRPYHRVRACGYHHCGH